MNQHSEQMHKTSIVKDILSRRSLVLIGLMGAGKSAIGRRLSTLLDVPFIDADNEIEAAAGKSISEIFSEDGEPYFRDREEKVIERLLHEGPMVLATGGGAYMSQVTRDNIEKHSISLWLKADLDVLMERVGRRDTRPLLQGDDPRGVMKRLMDDRYPVYELADLTIESRDVLHEVIIDEIIEALSKSPDVSSVS